MADKESWKADLFNRNIFQFMNQTKMLGAFSLSLNNPLFNFSKSSRAITYYWVLDVTEKASLVVPVAHILYKL